MADEIEERLDKLLSDTDDTDERGKFEELAAEPETRSSPVLQLETSESVTDHGSQSASAQETPHYSGILSTSSSPAEVTVPWHIERNHKDCDPDQWAVVNSDGDTVEECFTDRAEAVALFDKLTTGEPADDGDDEQDLALADTDTDEQQCPPGQRWDSEAQECVPGEGKQETASSRRSPYAADKTKPKSKPPARQPADKTECPPGQHLDEESGECVPDEELSGNVDVQGVAVVEGMWTGDGRQFALGALAWPDPQDTNLALQWQKEGSHGGQHDNTVNVGWLTSLERDGDRILVTATIDTDSTDGAEAARALTKRGRFGVSIVADNPDDSEIEFVYPEECDAALADDSDGELDDIPMACFMPKAIFHSGRIRALTIVDVPAFVEAYIEPVASAASLQASGHTFGAVATHETETTDTDWDGAAQEQKLGDEVTLDSARAMYAWVDETAAVDDTVAKSACKFPHHEVSDDGTPGAANLTACSAGIGALNGARGGADVPAGDKQGVYDHLAAHLTDAGQEPPPPSFVLKAAIAPLIAAAHQITLSDTPPASWFEEPTNLPEVGAIAVTDEGRVYGLLAPRHVAHRSFEKRVTVPTGNVDYSRWMNRQTIVAGGGRVTTGPITMGCGHAATDPWVSADSSLEHYDNSCSVVATVRIGENSHGVWIAGALLPDVTPHQVARMLACQLSGDWRAHPEKPGKREMCGALLVPVPGFPVAASASVRLDHGQLVAAAAPVEWHAADTVTRSEVTPSRRDRQTGHRQSSAVKLATDTLPSWEDVQRRRQNREELRELSAQIGIEA